MARAQLCYLASRAGNHILMALRASCRVINRTQAATGPTRIVLALELRLIESECVAGRFGGAIAHALRSGTFRQGRGVKAGGRFGDALSRHERDENGGESEYFPVHSQSRTQPVLIKFPAKL